MIHAVLGQQPFRRLWLSQGLSSIGNHLVTVVLALVVTDLTGSAAAVGVVLAARFGPLVLLTLYGGVWADRLSRRKIVIATDVIRLALHAALAALFFAGAVEVWHIVVIEALFSAAEAFAIPAYHGLIPQTVPEDDIQSATALTALASNAAQLLGPAAGTVLFVASGAGFAFAVDAATFAVSAVLLVGVREPRRGVAAVNQSNAFAELSSGFAEVRTRTWLWTTILTANVWLLVLEAPRAVLGPFLANQHYGSIGVYGAFVAVSGGGMLVGSLAALWWRPSRPLVAAYLAALPVPLAVAALATGAPLAVVWLLAAAGGFGAACFEVLWSTALAVEVDPSALSRVVSFDYAASFASLPLGYLLAGPLAEAVGFQTVALWGAAMAAALCGIGLLPSSTRHLSGKRRGRRPDADIAPPFTHMS